MDKGINDLEMKVSILVNQLMEEYAENHSDKTRHTLISVLGEREFYARYITAYDIEYNEERVTIARLIRG